MTNIEKDPRVDSLIATYLGSNTLRPEILFRHFLPTGYQQTTLDSVPPGLFHAVIYAKLHLGMIITLYDDFADHPKYRNPVLLQYMYQLNVGVDRPAPGSLSEFDLKNYELARFLFLSLTQVLKTFPHAEILMPVLRFDIEQFYSSNRHSELMTSLPSIRNLTESLIMGPHNMGIMAAGTIDLMASPEMDLMELGACREIFHLGQRMGRTSNIIFTLLRETAEGDGTNEILISAQTKNTDEATYKLQLLREFSSHVEEISSRYVQSFNSVRYAQGFENLHRLQGSLVGQI